MWNGWKKSLSAIYTYRLTWSNYRFPSLFSWSRDQIKLWLIFPIPTIMPIWTLYTRIKITTKRNFALQNWKNITFKSSSYDFYSNFWTNFPELKFNSIPKLQIFPKNSNGFEAFSRKFKTKKKFTRSKWYIFEWKC